MTARFVGGVFLVAAPAVLAAVLHITAIRESRSTLALFGVVPRGLLQLLALEELAMPRREQLSSPFNRRLTLFRWIVASFGVVLSIFLAVLGLTLLIMGNRASS